MKGAALQNAELVEIIETRTGAPLAMVEVRESMAHLFGLGLYQDVQVDASLRGDGVVLTYNLFPAQRVRRIVFEGSLGLPESDLRRIIVERHGASPSLARSRQAVATLQTVYRDRGYPKAEIAVRAGDEADSSNVSMVFSVRPGAARAHRRPSRCRERRAIRRRRCWMPLDLRVGDEYDGVELDERLARYANELRAQGYYEARVAAVSSIRRRRYGREPRAEHRAGTARRDRVRGRSARRRRSRSSRPDRARALGGRRPARGLEIRHRAALPRARLLQSARRLPARRAEPAKPEADADVLRVTFTVTRGPQCMVEQAEVTGNTLDHVGRAGAARRHQSRPAVQRLHRRLRCAANPGLLPPARIHGCEGDVSGRAARAEGRQRVRARQARDCRRRALGHRLGELSGQHGHSTPTRCGAPSPSAPGQPYFEPQISGDADTIALLYLNRGYPEVTVEPAPKAIGDGSKVELGFAIHEGPQILIDHVLIVGNQRTSRDTILREVQLKSGQPLSQQQEDETRTRITSLGLFRRVDISYLQLPGEQNRRDVVITVEEAPVTTISYGGGLEGGKRLVRSSETADAVEEFQFAPRGFFQVSRRNLFGKDRSLDLFTRVSFRPEGGQRDVRRLPSPGATIDEGGYGFNEYLARLTYGERRILGTDADATISGGVEQAVRSSFDFNRRGASATITRRINRDAGRQRTLRHRPHAAAEHQVELRRAARDRSAVSAGAHLERGVVDDSRHAQRFDRAEQRKPDRRRRRAGGEAHRIGGRVLQDVRAGIHLSAAARDRVRPFSCSAGASGWRRAFRASVSSDGERRSF